MWHVITEIWRSESSENNIEHIDSVYLTEPCWMNFIPSFWFIYNPTPHTSTSSPLSGNSTYLES